MPFWKLYYHLVWCTDKRAPMIVPGIEHELHRCIKEKIAALGGEPLEIGNTADHIHLGCTIPPTIAVAKFVGEVKGASSFHINHIPDNPNGVAWAKGYGAVSFRKDNLSQVEEYIRRQKEHHASGKLWPTLEDCGEEPDGKPSV